MDAGQFLRLAAGAERFSAHPIAKAILAEAEKRGLEIPQPNQFTNHPGYGVVAEVDGRKLLAGNRAMLEKFSVSPLGGVIDHPDLSAPKLNSTVVYLAEQLPGALVYLGQIEINDTIKADSLSAINRLQKMGLSLVMLTGDNAAAAAAIAGQVQIDQIYSDVRPDEKAAVIQKLQNGSTHRVAMVGDGINDAPALATANLGIALGSGSDVAKETGDIVLVGGSLAGVAASIVLSRATMRTIRQNLFLAFIYNVLAIPLAALGVLHPVVAAAAMALSDVTVLGNSLRLRWIRISD